LVDTPMFQILGNTLPEMTTTVLYKLSDLHYIVGLIVVFAAVIVDASDCDADEPAADDPSSSRDVLTEQSGDQ